MSAVSTFDPIQRDFKPSLTAGLPEFHTTNPERANGSDLHDRTGFKRTRNRQVLPPVEHGLCHFAACESALEAYLALIDLLPISPPELGELADQLYAASRAAAAITTGSSDTEQPLLKLAAVLNKIQGILANVRAELDFQVTCEQHPQRHWSEFESALFEALSSLREVSRNLAALEQMPSSLRG
jgi:hypothetical protein